MFVYFIFIGYRVAIGRTNNLYGRIKAYKRTYFSVEVLGLIPCDTTKLLCETERDILKKFENDVAFREMFYLSNDMIGFIVNNTIPCTENMIKDSHNVILEQKREYKKRPEVKERRQQYDKENYKRWRNKKR